MRSDSIVNTMIVVLWSQVLEYLSLSVFNLFSICFTWNICDIWSTNNNWSNVKVLCCIQWIYRINHSYEPIQRHVAFLISKEASFLIIWIGNVTLMAACYIETLSWWLIHIIQIKIQVWKPENFKWCALSLFCIKLIQVIVICILIFDLSRLFIIFIHCFKIIRSLQCLVKIGSA